MHEQISTSPILLHSVLACFGAIVHALKAHRNNESKTLVDFIILIIMASFTGVMFALLALQLFPNQVYITLAIAGSGGFMGVEGMAIIIDVIRQIINKKT